MGIKLMGFIFYNPNPLKKEVGDCVIRAITKVTNSDWDTVFLGVMSKAFTMKDVLVSNEVWSEYLYDQGFRRHIIPNTCPMCYTVREFCLDNSIGIFLLATGSHVVAVVNGNYYDSWDSGSQVPIYYWRKEF